MIAGYMTTVEAAAKWELEVRTVQLMCSQGKIEGATKFGKLWAIPVNVRRPVDSRIKSGDYKDWRKKRGLTSS